MVPVLTFPVVVTFSPPSAVAPMSLYGSRVRSSVTGLSPLRVMTGGVVSSTVTVRDTVPTLPAASVAEYTIVYTPTLSVLTEPLSVTGSPPSDLAFSST